MADDKYYRITKDEALFNAYNAYANTNNPDDRAKIENLYDSFKKGKISTSEFNVAIMQAAKEAAQKAAEREHPGMVDKLADVFVNRPISNISSTAQNIANAVMQAAKAQGKTDVAKQGGTPTTDGAHTEKVAANPGNGIDAQGKSEIPNSSEVSAANAAKAQAEVVAQAEAVAKAKADAAALASAGNKNKSGKKPGMSDAEIDAFLKGELGTTGWSSDKGLMRKGDNGTLASAGVAKGGTKTIGFDDPYDPNPGNVSLAYTLRNAPEQERRTALINAWNKEHGISYVTGKDGVIYRIDPQHPNGYVDPFKNDLSTWTRATRSGSTYASPGISSGGTYATGEGIKDANGNILTNPGGNADYQYALRDPSYGIYVRDRLTDAQKEYLQAVAHDMGYNYDR